MEEQDRSKEVLAAVESKQTQVTVDQIEEVFRQHHALVFRAARRVTGDASDAEDVLQTVFLRLVRRAPDSAAIDDVESYLYRAAVNCALDLARSRQKVRSISLDEVTPQLTADTRLAPDRAQAGGEIRTWLRNAIARLSPAAAEMFVLRFFEGRQNAEIARAMGATPATVPVTLHRARERLQREFQAASQRPHVPTGDTP